LHIAVQWSVAVDMRWNN